MLRKVVVTGIGLATPLGCETGTVWSRLLAGESGISLLKGEEYKNIPSKVAGFVPVGKTANDFNAKLYSSSSTSLSTAFALQCTETAIKDAGLENMSDSAKLNTGVSLGVGMVDLKYIENSAEALKKRGYKKVSPFFVPKLLPNMAAGHIGIKYGLKGPNICISTACTTGVHAIGDAYRTIGLGDCDIMVAGAAEACICPLSVAGFARANALSTEYNDTPESSSRPFDVTRDGFVIAEGAGVVILEEEEHARKRNAKVYGRICGYGMSCDATHITSPPEDGDGAYRSMHQAIKNSNVELNDVEYINAHATSTPTGDVAEIKAIEKLFHNQTNLKVSSTKGATGHLLGAAGAIESIFTILSCFRGRIPPTINLQQPDADIIVNLVANKSVEWLSQHRVALSNSFGFGGTNATLCISNAI